MRPLRCLMPQTRRSTSTTLCPSGLRGLTQVPLARAAWAQIPQVSFVWSVARGRIRATKRGQTHYFMRACLCVSWFMVQPKRLCANKGRVIKWFALLCSINIFVRPQRCAVLSSCPEASPSHTSLSLRLLREGCIKIKKDHELAEHGFDPRTFGLWAQHASHCATPLRRCAISGSPTSSTSDTGPQPADPPHAPAAHRRSSGA